MQSKLYNVSRIKKLVVANRGEIAVRVIRAAKDAGIGTVAVYADQDRNALFSKAAHEAYALNGRTPIDTYLAAEKILTIARRTGANAIHPGYGFLSENASFAQMIIDAGLIWIGPPPEAILALGDKVSARRIAREAGAPLAPGTQNPIASPSEVVAFAEKHGLPIAIKASHGGGGRGLKIARTVEEIEDQFDSAVREALAAFGRGECFVEKYLQKPRHIETQCLADKFGNVVVISTRDWSLQRRHQKLVEEAPAPFLTPDQEKALYESSKSILRAAGYVGAGTCEFLLGADGTLSFLEVNTRLQVEHPVSEEVTGIDLVREQLRIAEGEPIGYEDPPVTGHSIEFRVNGEDPGRHFSPAPGHIQSVRFPGGPGVRVDTGITSGDIISDAFDSLLAKIIITGSNRQDALTRARRALDEFALVGLPTVIPFLRKILDDPAFIAANGGDFGVHTRWIEEDLDLTFEPWDSEFESDFSEEALYRSIVVEVEGRRQRVGVPAGIFQAGIAASKGRPPSRRKPSNNNQVRGKGLLVSPMQATVVSVLARPGDTVVAGDKICIIEAMKMEQPVLAPFDGVIDEVQVSPGDTLKSGQVISSLRPQ